MYEAAARNLRTAERFLLQPPLSGQFGASAVSVCDISAKGARFTHGHAIEMGEKSVLRLALEGRPQPVQLEAVVVWSHPDSTLAGRYVSGVRTYGSAEAIDGVLYHLQQSKRTTRIEELRARDRFTMLQPLAALFDGEPVTVENLSARGARVVVPREVSPGTRGMFVFAVPQASLNVNVPAQVAWSSLRSLDPTSYRAGIAVGEKAELMRLAIGQLCESGAAILDTQSLALKLKVLRARARQLAPSFRAVEASGVPAEQYLLIQCVREELRLNPEEALHWYRRARLTIADPQTRRHAPTIADHPDALAVWEYLDRSVDPSLIGRAFALE